MHVYGKREPKLTFGRVKAILANEGLDVAVDEDAPEGKYRVSFKPHVWAVMRRFRPDQRQHAHEAAYYTGNLSDALVKGLLMAQDLRDLAARK